VGFDTAGILSRFHLWLDDVEALIKRDGAECCPSSTAAWSGVVGGSVTSSALTLRTLRRAGADKAGFNRVKKDADAVSAYALSEALWYLTRSLPENHAVMVNLGEGLMPKAGETPEMGSNPLLGFGRVYAGPGGPSSTIASTACSTSLHLGGILARAAGRD
jgi:hypothetical protein